MILATLATDEIQNFREISFPNKEAYCRRHGHTFCGITERLHLRRPHSWSKIKLLEIISFTSQGQWVFWSDADSIITRPEWNVEELIDPEADLIIARGPFGINAGVFLMHLNQRTHEFLLEVHDQIQYVHHNWWEQAAMMHLLNANYPIRVKTGDKVLMNAFPEDYQEGYSAVLHVAGATRANRVEELKKRLPRERPEAGRA
jgi:hypothetical protein